MQVLNPLDFGAVPDGSTLCTEALQKAIDAASAVSGTLRFPAGTYLTGSLFLKSNMTLELPEDATLLGVVDESAYPMVPTRVAGIEMIWPAGLLNVRDAENVKICGGGTVDGQGEYWWDKYWGQDRLGGMRGVYTPKGLRWAVDYDCTRPRNVIVFRSKHVTISGLVSRRSPFWNIHLCYSEDLLVEHVSVGQNAGPSTDGIDIDSCNGVVIRRCHITCNDDSICVKSGRDADGLRVNRVCENVEIYDCDLGLGAGITLGSETSGGIRNVYIHDCRYHSTSCGFRIKSAHTRGGLIENIKVRNLQMTNVREPFSFDLNWNPSYSYCEIPADYTGEVPDHWKVLSAPVSKEQGMPEVRGLDIADVKASLTPDYTGKSYAFLINAYPEKPIRDVRMKNIEIQAYEFGSICHIEDWELDHVLVDVCQNLHPSEDDPLTPGR